MPLENKKKHLIGFTGNAGVGKTTTASWFVNAFGFVRLSFAQPVKDALSALTGLPMEYFTDIKLKEKEVLGINTTPRELMQLMATEFLRDMIHQDFFLWRMRNMISDVSDKHIVIDDIRFENEAQLVRDNGGIIIHLKRDFDSPTNLTSHSSERSIRVNANDWIIQSSESAELTALRISERIIYI